jgi:hypothetical protein
MRMRLAANPAMETRQFRLSRDRATPQPWLALTALIIKLDLHTAYCRPLPAKP